MENTAYSAASAVIFEFSRGLTSRGSFAVFVAEFVRIPKLKERVQRFMNSVTLAKPVAHDSPVLSVKIGVHLWLDPITRLAEPPAVVCPTPKS